MKKHVVIPLVLILVLGAGILLAVLCRPKQDEKAARATAFLTALFTVPPKGFEAAFSPTASLEESVQGAHDAFLSILEGLVDEEIFTKPHSSILSAFSYLQKPERNLTPLTITVTPTGNETIYDYQITAQLAIPGEEPREVPFNGSIQFNEDGLIDYISLNGRGITEIADAKPSAA